MHRARIDAELFRDYAHARTAGLCQRSLDLGLKLRGDGFALRLWKGPVLLMSRGGLFVHLPLLANPGVLPNVSRSAGPLWLC